MGKKIDAAEVKCGEVGELLVVGVFELLFDALFVGDGWP